MTLAWRHILTAASFLGVGVALSVIQQRTELATLHAGEPPSIADVKDQLAPINDTMDKVSESIDTINSTAYGFLDTFLSSTADFVAVLDVLQKAADAASLLPGGEKITEAATKFIDLANSSIAKAQEDLPAIVAKAEEQIGPFLPMIQEIADSLVGQYLDAAQEVLDLSNYSDTSLVKKVKESKTHITKAAKKAKANKGNHAKNGIALLQERALRSEGMASSSISVDRSVSQKGSTNPCSKALASIDKANTSIGKMAAEVQGVNTTGFALLGQILEVAGGALDTLNSSIAPALDAASAAVPASVLSPVTSGLDKVLAVADTLSSTVDEQLSTVQSMVEDALSTLSTVYSLSDTLVDAVAEAQCQGACGDKLEAACAS